jgi:hypothetical protein
MGSALKVFLGITLVVLVTALLPSVVLSCASCYGNPDSSATEGMNMAILSLLGVTGGVLAAFGAFFLHLMRRARRLQERLSSMMN